MQPLAVVPSGDSMLRNLTLEFHWPVINKK